MKQPNIPSVYTGCEAHESRLQSFLEQTKINVSFGSVELKPVESVDIFGSTHATKMKKIERDEQGKINKETVFDSHLVCCGVDVCFICGRKMS